MKVSLSAQGTQKMGTFFNGIVIKRDVCFIMCDTIFIWIKNI